MVAKFVSKWSKSHKKTLGHVTKILETNIGVLMLMALDN